MLVWVCPLCGVSLCLRLLFARTLTLHPLSHSPSHKLQWAVVTLKRALNHTVHSAYTLTSTWHWPDDYLLNSGHWTFLNVLQHRRHTVVGSYWTRSQLKHPDLFHTYAIRVFFHSASHSTNIAFKKIISTPKADNFPQDDWTTNRLMKHKNFWPTSEPEIKFFHVNLKVSYIIYQFVVKGKATTPNSSDMWNENCKRQMR